MAKVVTEKWQCDRCGAVMDERPYYGKRGTYRITASCDYAVDGDRLEWKELCPPCNSHIGRLIGHMREDAKAEIAAQAE